VAADRLDPFGKRILDLQHVLVAGSEAELRDAGAELARRLQADVAPG
jgi:hypothetical protein